LVGLKNSENKNVGQLYREKLIKVKIPLYLDREYNLGKMIKSFQSGRAHMAVVLHTHAAA